MRALLDINILLALLDKAHVHRIWWSFRDPQPRQNEGGPDKVQQHPTLFEFKSGLFQEWEGLAVEMAASADSRPEGREKLVELSR